MVKALECILVDVSSTCKAERKENKVQTAFLSNAASVGMLPKERS